jgi:hypothetical protein
MVRQDTLARAGTSNWFHCEQASQIPIRSQAKQRTLPLLESNGNQDRTSVAARTRQEQDSRAGKTTNGHRNQNSTFLRIDPTTWLIPPLSKSRTHDSRPGIHYAKTPLRPRKRNQDSDLTVPWLGTRIRARFNESFASSTCERNLLSKANQSSRGRRTETENQDSDLGAASETETGDTMASKTRGTDKTARTKPSLAYAPEDSDTHAPSKRESISGRPKEEGARVKLCCRTKPAGNEHSDNDTHTDDSRRQLLRAELAQLNQNRPDLAKIRTGKYHKRKTQAAFYINSNWYTACKYRSSFLIWLLKIKIEFLLHQS